jgi:hypothetical protein
MKSNKMVVNGKEEDWTDAQMRDWFENHCEALNLELYNRNATLRKLSKEYKDLLLRNEELSEELKRIKNEEK